MDGFERRWITAWRSVGAAIARDISRRNMAERLRAAGKASLADAAMATLGAAGVIGIAACVVLP